jgi:hypothetical protein
MPVSKISTLAATAILLTLVSAGCGGGDKKASSSSPSSSTTPSATPSATPTPTTTPTSTATSATPAGPRTAAELKRALLTLKDLPSGFSIEPDTGGGTVKASSKKPACARLVAFMNVDNPPGSKASAAQSFSGGQQGPFVDESLDAMGTAQAVAILQNNFRNAIRACKTLTLSVPGEGKSIVEVREVSAPEAGTSPVAVRFTATSGPAAGLEINMVTTGVGDVVAALTVVGTPDDVDGAAQAAVDKATSTLKTGKTGA